jgi:hypothetical protein
MTPGANVGHYEILAPLPRRSGRCNSSGKLCRAIIPTASSSMIAIASSQRKSTRVSRTWEYEFCGRRCEPPKANAVCERVGGSLRRECLDFLLPFNAAICE